MSTLDAAGEPQGRASLGDWVAVGSTMLGAFMAVLDVQVTNAALANIQGGIGAGASEGSWISTAYLSAEIISIPLSGWTSRMLGQKRFLLIYTALFILFSVLCGLSTSLEMMIVARALQGFTGGVLIPTALTVLRRRLPRPQQPMGVALFGATVTFAPTLGTSVGGWLTDHFSWHYLFFINVVPGLVGLLAMQLSLVPTAPDRSLLRQSDWPGIGLMAVGLASLTIMLEEGQRWGWFSAPLVRLLAVAATLGTGGFIVRELTASRPFINLRLLGDRMVGTICIMTTVAGGVMFGSTYIIPLYCAQVQNYDPQRIGLVVMFAGLTQLVAFPMTPWLMRRIDLRLIVLCGIALVAVSCWMNTKLTQDVGLPQLILPQLLRGLGLPLFAGPMNQLIASSVSNRDMPDASALTSMMRNLGGSFFIAAIGAVTERREHFHFSVIAERVTRDSLHVQQQVAAMTDGVGGNRTQALGLLAQMVRKQASIMAFADGFALIGVSLAVCVFMVAILRRTPRIA